MSLLVETLLALLDMFIISFDAASFVIDSVVLTAMQATA